MHVSSDGGEKRAYRRPGKREIHVTPRTGNQDSMEERRSDTSETYGDQSLPDDASNQNSEEPSAPSQGSGDGSEHKDHPRSEDEGNPGGAGEGSQATGHPENAG
jgi:hypothetical protein